MIGIIGGSGVYEITENAECIEKLSVNTDFGSSVDISLLEISNKEVAFISRHSSGHSIPSHKINYRANIDALKKVGVNQIIATNAVGSLNLDLGPGAIVLPDDFIDFTYLRNPTFFDKEVVHIDVTEPYCKRLRDKIASCGDITNGSVYVCTEGPRFETPSEIKMFKILGGDLVGMTGLPEAVLAKEKEICYSSICLVSNYGAGISKEKLTMDEVFEIMDLKKAELIEIIYKTIEKLDDKNQCDCLDGLNGAKV